MYLSFQQLGTNSSMRYIHWFIQSQQRVYRFLNVAKKAYVHVCVRGRQGERERVFLRIDFPATQNWEETQPAIKWNFRSGGVEPCSSGSYWIRTQVVWKRSCSWICVDGLLTLLFWSGEMGWPLKLEVDGPSAALLAVGCNTPFSREWAKHPDPQREKYLITFPLMKGSRSRSLAPLICPRVPPLFVNHLFKGRFYLLCNSYKILP